MHVGVIESRNDGAPPTVDNAGRRPAQTQSLFIATGRSHFSIRNSERLDKRGHLIRGDLGVVQDNVSRHRNLLLHFSIAVGNGRKQASARGSITCELRQQWGRRTRGTSWPECRVPSCTRTRRRSRRLRSGSSQCPSRRHKFPCEPSRAATPAWLKVTSRV